jgi:Flp pilus assembly protein TadD
MEAATMSRTLNLAVRLLARGRNLYRLGAMHQALDVFNRLSGFQQLPARVARHVLKHLARIKLRQRRFAAARRHLVSLLVHEPDNARFHYLMARAIAADPRCARERAVIHCRKAARLAPRHAGYASTFGLLALRAGKQKEGLACLRRAVELAPDEPRMVRRLVKGLTLIGRADEARAVLLAALFRSGGDNRIRRLWNDHRFLQLHRKQQRRHRQALGAEPGPTLLPFICVTPLADERPTDCRTDAPTVLPGPHQSRTLRRPDQRHAQ